MKKVAEQFPDDVEAWIELGGILEQSDVQVGMYVQLYLYQQLATLLSWSNAGKIAWGSGEFVVMALNSIFC